MARRLAVPFATSIALGLGLVLAGPLSPAHASLAWGDDPCETRGGQVALTPDLSVILADSAAAYVICVDGTLIHHGLAGGNVAEAVSLLPAADYVDLGMTPDGNGLYVVTDRGTVTAQGDAVYFGELSREPADVVALEVTPSGAGYWLVTAAGDVVGFGDARSFAGDVDAESAGPAAAFAALPGGDGGWLATAYGDLIPVGGAPGLGSVAGSLAEGDSVVGLVAASADGAWVVTESGQILSLGSAPIEYDAAECLALPDAHPPVAGAVGDARPDASATLWTYSVHGGICGFKPGA